MGRRESLVTAFSEALREAGARHPRLVVIDADRTAPIATEAFGQEFPERLRVDGIDTATMVPVAAEIAREGHPVVLHANVADVLGNAYGPVRAELCLPQAPVTIVGRHAGLSASGPTGGPPALEDLGIVRSLPGMSVVVPADAPSARSAALALIGGGPSYLRLTTEELPTVSDGRFELGRIAERRSGHDLSIIAVGRMVALALEVAQDLHEVGIEARVLDSASIKPFDEPAILRAARDTGALLTLEEHSVTTGLGALVAATTAENYPVPVRRIGIPDVFVRSSNDGDPSERYGLTRTRARDEAWELLRARGKVQ